MAPESTIRDWREHLLEEQGQGQISTRTELSRTGVLRASQQTGRHHAGDLVTPEKPSESPSIFQLRNI